MSHEYTPDGERERLGRRERVTPGDGPHDVHDEECWNCGDVRPPDGTGARVEGVWRPLCPACEDLIEAGRTHDHPPGNPPRTPPHGNTTR